MSGTYKIATLRIVMRVSLLHHRAGGGGVGWGGMRGEDGEGKGGSWHGVPEQLLERQ